MCQSAALLTLTRCIAVSAFNLMLAVCTSKVDTVQGDETAQKKFQEVSEAYDTLKESSKRSLYDRVGPEGMENMGGFNGAQGGFEGAQGFAGFGVRTCCAPLPVDNTTSVITTSKIPATAVEIAAIDCSSPAGAAACSSQTTTQPYAALSALHSLPQHCSTFI